MSQQLINHSNDLKKLRDEGLNIEVSGGYLLVHNIPYVNSDKKIKEGSIISELTLSGNITAKPKTHVVYFEGEVPCDKGGNKINEIYHSNPNKRLIGSHIGNHMFSNKPKGGYDDYYEKISQYIRIISAPAKSLDPEVTERKYIVIESDDDNGVFNYIDSNSSRANVCSISEKLKNQKVGIIGLGGTGSYLLDFIAKTPVKEILLFDGDLFLQHNAFRSPGAPSIDDLNRKMYKSDYLKDIYSHMRRGILSIHDYICTENVSFLEGTDIVFICIDRTDIKKVIIDFLLEKEISFIDVGIGVNVFDDKLSGIIRVTSSTKEKREHIQKRISFLESTDDDYATNIQIAELNALNASLAVIKWKKMLGFYQDYDHTFHSTYTIDTGVLINEED